MIIDIHCINENKFQPDKIEITADFSRLNFLVMKIEETDGVKHAHKVATATMSSAKVQATIGKLL